MSGSDGEWLKKAVSCCFFRQINSKAKTIVGEISVRRNTATHKTMTINHVLHGIVQKKVCSNVLHYKTYPVLLGWPMAEYNSTRILQKTNKIFTEASTQIILKSIMSTLIKQDIIYHYLKYHFSHKTHYIDLYMYFIVYTSRRLFSLKMRSYVNYKCMHNLLQNGSHKILYFKILRMKNKILKNIYLLSKHLKRRYAQKYFFTIKVSRNECKNNEYEIRVNAKFIKKVSIHTCCNETDTKNFINRKEPFVRAISDLDIFKAFKSVLKPRAVRKIETLNLKTEKTKRKMNKEDITVDRRDAARIRKWMSNGLTKEQAMKHLVTTKRGAEESSEEEHVAKKSFSDVVKNNHLHIVHGQYPSKNLQQSEICAVIKCLHNSLDEEVNVTDLKFEKLEAGVNSVKIIVKNEKTLKWIKEIVEKIGKGQTMKIIEGIDLPKLVCATIKIGDPSLSEEKIRMRLKKQNTDLDVDNWYLVKKEMHKDGDVIVTFEMPKASADKIKKERNRISFGFNEIYVQFVYNSEARKIEEEIKTMELVDSFSEECHLKKK